MTLNGLHLRPMCAEEDGRYPIVGMPIERTTLEEL